MDGLNDAFVNFSDSDIINNIDIRHPVSNDLDVGFNLNSILSNTSDSLDTPNLPIKQAPHLAHPAHPAHPAPTQSVQHHPVPTQAMNSEQNVRQQYAQHQQQVAHQQHQLAQQILAQQQAQQAHQAQQAQHVQHVQPKMMPKMMPKMQQKVMPHVQQIAPKVVPKLQPKVHFHDTNQDESGIINTRTNPNPPVMIKHDSPVQVAAGQAVGQAQDTQTQMPQTIDAVDANAADVGLDALPVPDHMTSLMGYSIPTATLYFIFVMLLIAFGIYYLTSPAKKPEPKKKEHKNEHDQDKEQGQE